MRVLIVSDRFIPAQYYVEALAHVCGGSFGPICSVEWSGSKAEQHATQQIMERLGPDAVRVPEEIMAAVGDAEVLVVHLAPVQSAVLQAAPRLRAVCVARAGTENIDVAAATARRAAVVPVYGRNASAVAEFAVGLMITQARDIVRTDTEVKTGGWPKAFGHTWTEVGDSTVGIVGIGHVGRALADRLKGFGSRILAYDPYVPDDVLARHGAARAHDLETVFQESDFVNVCARLTPQTNRFIGARHFAAMKPNAYLINAARSRLIDTGALYEALASGRIAGAGLDVHDEEPLPPDSLWRRLNNVTLTTHTAGDTRTTNLRSARLVAESIAELADSGRCKAAINADDLEGLDR